MSKDFLLLLFVSDLWSIAFLKTARVLSSCSFAASFQEIIISITLLCACQGGNKCSLLRKFDVLCFLETPVLRFGLLPYYRQYKGIILRVDEKMILKDTGSYVSCK